MDKLWKKIRHNQSLVIGMILAAAVVLWAYGCHSTVVSVLSPPAKVTRAELQQEVDSLLERAKIRFAELDRQDQTKSTIFNASIEFLRGSTVNPVGVAITLGNILGLGAIIDNRRKDVRIKSLKTEIENGKTKVKKTEAKKPT